MTIVVGDRGRKRWYKRRVYRAQRSTQVVIPEFFGSLAMELFECCWQVYTTILTILSFLYYPTVVAVGTYLTHQAGQLALYHRIQSNCALGRGRQSFG